MMTDAERKLIAAHQGFSQRERTVKVLFRALVLGQGWCSIHDIHREVGFCRLNSRVAEARKVFKRDGHPFDIKHSIRDGQHGYELVPLEEPERYPRCRTRGGPAAIRKDAALSGSSSGSNLDLGLPHAQEDGSLVLEGQGQLL